MKHAWAWFAVALIALEAWYLVEQGRLLRSLRDELSPRPRPAAAGANIATAGPANAPGTTPPSGPKPVISVEIGRELKSLYSAPLPSDVKRKIYAHRIGPEQAQAERGTQERFISLKYGLLFAMLDLPAAETEAVSRLLFNQANIKQDIGAAIEASRPPGQKQDIVKDSDLFWKLLKRTEAEDLARLKDTLGEERFSLYLDYEANLPRYATVAALQQELAVDPANALSRQQASDLIALFKRDPTAEVRLLLPVIDTARAQAEVAGLRFAIVEKNRILLIDDHHLESAYIPANESIAQARFLNPAQLNALNDIVRRRAAAHALAEDFWVKPLPNPQKGSQ